jgi:antitoxin YefM
MPELVTIQDVYEALKRIEEKMATREDVEALIDSVEILNNPKTMEALRKSDQDIESGRVKEVTSVKELLDELLT